MIGKLTITDMEDLPLGWWSEVKWLRKNSEFKFEPGLNIIFGKNATGKSTLLQLLAMTFHCYDGGYPKVTQSSIAEIMGGLLDQERKKGYSVEHDGNLVFYINPDMEVGLKGGSFDNDFMAEGVQNLFNRNRSQGERSLGKMTKIFEDMDKQDDVIYTFHEDCVNDVWAKKLQHGLHILKNPTIGNTGRKTILIDEPERSMDFENEIKFWGFIKRMAERDQVIVATHSPFALYTDANFIQTTYGYITRSKKLIEKHLGTGDDR